MKDIILNTLNYNALYLDTSMVTVLITSISGVAVALGAAIVIFLRKAKKKVAKTFHIDENAGKEVEDDVVLTDVDEDED